MIIIVIIIIILNYSKKKKTKKHKYTLDFFKFQRQYHFIQLLRKQRN